MAKFGKNSMRHLKKVHPNLLAIMQVAITAPGYDFSVISGVRTEREQGILFAAGKSKLNGITLRSKHQKGDDGFCHAVDIAPYPYSNKSDTSEKKRLHFLAGVIFGVTAMLLLQGAISHGIRWGGDWDSDFDFEDQNFNDWYHFELVPLI